MEALFIMRIVNLIRNLLTLMNFQNLLVSQLIEQSIKKDNPGQIYFYFGLLFGAFWGRTKITVCNT
jgi:hypothetical protein